MNGVVLSAALILVGGMSSVISGGVPAHGLFAELVWATLACAGLITVAGIEAAS
ncbi:hypothetical protein [Bosea sp. BK604]|uniref:hypothetical protein n=1 Tax=Bosea sp. BK604 TaxID=2512180 RepID=UPI0010D2B247|nr:hypothetical protein [Bosea sp. BK604]TCR66155.1 hypothetical protein EV560_10433 [Bosea sp. BK604]